MLSLRNGDLTEAFQHPSMENQTNPTPLTGEIEATKEKFATAWVDKQVMLQRLHISERTLQRWRSAKLFPVSKIGKKIFYHVEDVELMLRAHRR